MSVQRQSNSEIVLTPLQKTQIQELHELYAQADVLVKEVEEFIGEAGIPALNEMRYAGYHLAHSILLDECKFCDTQINSAINHCKRACYEASEAGIVVALLRFAEFREDYKYIVISDVLPSWGNIQKDFRTSQSKINAVSREKGGDDRSGDYSSRMDMYRELREHCEDVESARDDLNVVKRNHARSGRKFVIGALLTLLGIIVAGTFSFLQLTKDDVSQDKQRSALQFKSLSADGEK